MRDLFIKITIMPSLKDIWQYKKMFDNYKKLEQKLKNLIIRAKEWKYTEDWEEKERRRKELDNKEIINIDYEEEINKLHINDESLLDPSRKWELENLLITAIQKAHNKAQEVVAEQTKEILWVDTNDLAGMLGWWLPGLG